MHLYEYDTFAVHSETDEPMFRLASKDHQNATQWIICIAKLSH